MNHIKSQVVYNFKKGGGAYVSFGTAILITAIILNLALVLVFQVDKAYDQKAENLNVAAINICIPQTQDYKELSQDIKNLDGVLNVECKTAVYLEATVKKFRNTDHSMNTIFYNIDEQREMNKLDFKQETNNLTKGSIYLPLYMASFGEFNLNDEIIYDIDGKKHTFLVSAILEEMQYGNYANGIMGVYLPKEVYQKISTQYEQNKIVEYSIVTNSDSQIDDVNDEISKLLEEKNIKMLINSDKVSTKDMRTMVSNLLIIVLAVFAFCVLLVSGILCKFRINTFIEEDMINMGVLKSLGYTGNMIITGVVLPYIIVTAIASTLGILISYGILPILSEMLTVQSGFTFELKFDVASLFSVELILVVIVAMVTYMSARRIKKLKPINAIRGNVKENEIKKNHFPLEKTNINTNILLVMKQMFSNGKQNTLLFGVAFILTIMVSMASILYYNVIVKPNNFISTLSEEMPDVIISPKEQSTSELLNDLNSNSKVKDILEYEVGNVNIDDTPITVFATEDFSKVSNDLCYKGENPREKNEIALGSAFEKEYKVGDDIQIKNGDISYSYAITGFVQSVNYQGEVCELTIEGYSKLYVEPIAPELYIYLKEGVDVELFIEEIKPSNEDMISSVANYKEMIVTMSEMYSGITAVIVIFILGLAMVIVLLALYVVIKTLLTQLKQELGIYKSIGYSNRQLMMRFMASLLPAPILGVILSSALAVVYVPYINNFIFCQIGAIKNNLDISVLFLGIFSIIQIIGYLVIGLFLSKPIMNISPYKLIKED